MKALLVTILPGWIMLGQDSTAQDANKSREIFARISQVALRYEGQLPDFSCTQLTDRYRDDSGTGRQWKRQDTLEQAFNYLGGRASFKLVKINGKPPGKLHLFENSLGSEGVFNAALVPSHIFDTRVHARVDFQRDETRQGKHVYVFNYQVPPFLRIKQASKDFVVGFHGFFNIDPDTAMIAERHQVMDYSPPDSRYEYITDIAYGPVMISDREMFLPVRNEIQFVNCRKYAADSTVTFGEPK